MDYWKRIKQLDKLDISLNLLNELAEAVERRIPKKPLPSSIEEKEFICPVCSHSVGWERNARRVLFGYCPNCGQAIDRKDVWEE